MGLFRNGRATWLPALLALAAGLLIGADAQAATSTGLEDSLLRSLIGHVLGLDPLGGSGPHCAGLRACDLAFLGIVGVVVVVAIRLRHGTARRRLDLARRMVEQGMEPPQELLGTTRNDLRRGLVLVATGLGLLGASWLGGKGDLSPAGLIPGFIGLGYLASHRFAVRKQSGP